MSEPSKLTDRPEEKKSLVENVSSTVKKNKKMIMYAILVVLALVVAYVLFGKNVEQFRLCTETRADLGNAASAVSVPSGPSAPSAPFRASGASETSIGGPASSVVSESASAVRRELANLFKSYA